jgi:hypothetical protein
MHDLFLVSIWHLLTLWTVAKALNICELATQCGSVKIKSLFRITVK